MKYTEVTIALKDNLLSEVLVAELAELGFDGFEEQENLLAAYIPEQEYSKDALGAILNRYEVSCNTRTIAEQNWNATWERSFSPVTIGDFCVIRADFHEPQPDFKYELIITPKMSFGTGHHATTRLMVGQMQDLAFSGKRVLDFGTGTGVLAILASMLGASSVLGIDNDEWSAGNALENIERNGTSNVTIKSGSLEIVTDEAYDIILANINRHILLEYMDKMTDLLSNDGTIIMSGILKEDEKIVVSEALKAGLQQVRTTGYENWISISFKKHID